MSMEQSSGWSFLQWLWLVAGAVFAFLWRQISNKADKDDIDQKHRENQDQLAEIIRMIKAGDELARRERHVLRDQLNAVVVKVAVLADRAGLNERR